MSDRSPQQIADDLARTHLSPYYGHGGIRADIAAIITEERGHLTSLARLVIRTLEAQQRYLSTRSRFDLIQSKSLEKQLHATALGIVGPDVEPEVKSGPGRPSMPATPGPAGAPTAPPVADIEGSSS